MGFCSLTLIRPYRLLFWWLPFTCKYLVNASEYHGVSEQFCLQTEPRGCVDSAPGRAEVTRQKLLSHMCLGRDFLQSPPIRAEKIFRLQYSWILVKKKLLWFRWGWWSFLANGRKLSACMTFRRVTRMTENCLNKSRVWLWIISSLRISIACQWLKGKIHYRWLYNWPEKILEI